MLGLILIAVWMTFVAGYLIWQQLTGDLAERANSHQPSVFSSASGAVTAEKEDPRDVRRSLVYRPSGLSASAGGWGLKLRADR